MRRLVALAFAAVVVSASGVAHGNGRFPSTTSISFPRGPTQDLYLGVTFGLLISKGDGGFRWLCEANIGYEGTWDPKYRIDAAGTIYASTYDGLRISRDGGCTFTTAPDLGALWIEGLDVAANGDVWVATAEGAAANNVYRSTDGGRTFTATDNSSLQIWWKSVLTAQTDPQRVYIAGYQVSMVGDDAGTPAPPVHLRRSDDGGATWIALPTDTITVGDSPELHVEAVSPTDPDVVFVRSARAQGADGDRVYRSADGGLTYTEVLSTTAAIRAVVARANGDVIVATLASGAFLSTDGGLTFNPLTSPPRAACLGDRGDALFSCGANWQPDLFALGRSADGAAWTKVFRFVEIAGPLQCAVGTIQHDVCEVSEWPRWQADFGIKPPIDAGVEPPTPTPGGCCSGGGALAGPALALGAVTAAILLRRRRRKSCCE